MRLVSKKYIGMTVKEYEYAEDGSLDRILEARTVMVYDEESDTHYMLPHYYQEFRYSFVFDWGIRNVEALQLAYAILRDVGLEPDIARKYASQFRDEVLIQFQRETFELSRDEVVKWLLEKGILEDIPPDKLS